MVAFSDAGLWLMGRRKPEAIGPIIAENLLRLGWARIVPNATDIATAVAKMPGKKRMSRQRIGAIINAVNVEPDTIETLAKAIGVEPDELTRRR